MGIQGSLETMPIEELTTWLTSKQPSGLLLLRQGNATKSLVLRDGRIVLASSSDPREYFGQFLINLGLVSEQQLQQAFETQQETQILIGKILVMTGVLSEKQVHRVLQLKIRETFLDAFLWDAGLFSFQEQVQEPRGADVSVSIDLGELLQEGKTRRKQVRAIRQVIPNNHCRFRSLGDASPTRVPAGSMEQIALEMIEKDLSVMDILLRFHSPDFPVLKKLNEMIRAELIAVKSSTPVAADIRDPDIEIEVAPPEQNPAAHYLEQAKEPASPTDLEFAVTVLRKGLKANPEDGSLMQALANAEEELDQALQRMYPDGCLPVPSRKNLLQSSHKWSPAQRYLLERLDGKTTLAAIVKASPIKPVDLRRIVHAMTKAGVIQAGNT